VKDGDHCDSISIAYRITLEDFYFLNPQINDEFPNLRLGASYCVEAVGDIATYNGYPITTTAIVFTRPTPAPTSYPILTPPAISAKALGTLEDWDEYRNAFTYDWGDLDETNSCDMGRGGTRSLYRICYDSTLVSFLRTAFWGPERAIAS